jgi:mono/diheme cytochrome c family protein
MHHGLIQHKTYLTTYCKEQYEAKELNKHMMTGRIYRIVPDGARRADPPRLSTATTPQLVAHLAHANGWWRDTAQRLLVERGEVRALAPLRTMATKHANPLARLHAMWTLEGMRVRDPNVILGALGDREPKIRAAAVRLAEPLFATPMKEKATAAVLRLADDARADVRLQFALTVSALGTPQGDAAVVTMLTADCAVPRVREAVITGVRGRELDLIARLLATPQWSQPQPGRAAMLEALARCLVNEANPRRVGRLLEIVAEQSATDEWRQIALLDAFAQPAGAKRPRPPRAITLDDEPTVLLRRLARTSGELQTKLKIARERVHWPGEPGYQPPPPPPPLSEDQQAQFERGQGVYAATCAACHKPNGAGQPGLAPPLVDSEWVLGPPSRLARIVLHGVQGPITVEGQTYNLDMPGLGKLSDNEVADVMTYVRRAWDHRASPVAPAEVRKARASTRPNPWTERELLKVR